VRLDASIVEDADEVADLRIDVVQSHSCPYRSLGGRKGTFHPWPAY
jgi:hypothetical protein